MLSTIKDEFVLYWLFVFALITVMFKQVVGWDLALSACVSSAVFGYMSLDLSRWSNQEDQRGRQNYARWIFLSKFFGLVFIASMMAVYYNAPQNVH